MTLHKYVVSAEYGVMIGATVYVLGQLFHLWNMPADTVNLTGLVIMSALIGLLSLIFDSPRGSNLLLLSIHCGVTFAVVVATSYLCDWLIPYGGWWKLLGTFVLIYILVWAGLYLNSRIMARQMNLQLKQRKHQE
ncbi:DUF3021 domain-containing protein [Levilactobacillus namurensis]|uniref:DUF3021 domain-containing protein n=1 Tax=Levilactobacillus namurensis TaxID=380393 RepID=UPI001D6E8860|nr:DUF3021 domain-containing protein [Levilactobacillus namurensis]HJE45767.1 DUF3021 domain-containing protein [Levilactobacillus namurensis]